ncbi:MAG TPA: UvrD-helicase domain-containing protein [Rhodanobacteraceae bacterium]|nr:UvrD-helicase domain-containing protein [Rhodanobacteraceae bacterium]
MNAPVDALELPLEGIRAVTANAGTGKTFTIATLYLRLVLEDGLTPEQIVVATFTRAATAELADRIRGWLALAEALLRDPDPGRARADDGAEQKVLRGAIARALGGTNADGSTRRTDLLHARAQGALLAVDTAQISTLHGFCFRALGELGFDAGQPLRRPEPIDDLRALDLEIIRDFWRHGGADAATARLLADTWGDPARLAAEAGNARWENLPGGFDARVPLPDAAMDAAAFATARTRIAAWDGADQGTFVAELTRCVKTASTRTARTRDCEALRAWAAARGASVEGLDAKALGNLLADRLEGLQPKGARPEGRVFDDLAALDAAAAAIRSYPRRQARARAANLLCAAREVLVHERAKRLAARDLASQDQAVRALHHALQGPSRAALIARARGRWQAALVDEFQDTDRAQWEIVEALFGKTRLVIVGDPKQAIYGFRGGDVFAWQRAYGKREGEPLRLHTSYRSGTRLCAAVNALFGGKDPFLDAGIDYADVTASERSRACAVIGDGNAWPGIRFWHYNADALGLPSGPHSPPGKGSVKSHIEARTVGHIAWLLQHAQLRGREGGIVPLQPKHVAVLVNSNAEAASLQARLGAAGIPAASNLQASVYASEEADDLALLLEALADPADADRARAAWASRLVGRSATEIADSLDAGTGGAQADVTAWAGELARHGALAWMHRMLIKAAPRLLRESGGTRRVANYLQLAELLDAGRGADSGAAPLAARFAVARASVGTGERGDADEARLRLETDANAVTVATVHAAKGLEYDVVFLPYAGMGRNPERSRDAVRAAWYHDEAGTARLALGEIPPEIGARSQREALGEDVRKLYVAVTRARALCVIPWGRVNDGERTALFHLLRGAGGEYSDAGCSAMLARLAERAPDAIDVAAWDDIPTATGYAAPKIDEARLEAAPFRRTGLERDWQVWSFSRLVRGSPNDAAPDPAPGTGDDAETPGIPVVGLAGPRFGTAVHAVFEQTDFAAWCAATATPESERALVETSLRAQGLPDRGVGMEAAIRQVGDCVRGALNATLPCGMRLCDLPRGDRRAEIEFHFALAPAATGALYRTLHAHGYQRHREGLAPARLHGLMTGRIDLTFRHAGRFHLIDWKTNLCAAYDDATLDAEIARHDYDLQWLIYTLALHRWLGQRLPGYAYERDVGEVYYLFVRGMAAGAGVHVARPPRALIEALDRVLRPAGTA